MGLDTKVTRNRIDGNVLNLSLLNPTSACLYFFLVGSLMRIDVYILGRLAAGEILLLIALPFCLGSIGQILGDRYYKKMIVFLLLWMLGVIISDIANQSIFELFIRGIARPTLCLMILFPLYSFISKDPRCVIYFFFGLAFAGIANFIVPTDFRAQGLENYAESLDDISYSYFAYVWTPAIFGLASIGSYFIYRVSPYLCAVMLVIVAALVAPYFSRTSTAVFFISGVIIFIVTVFPNIGNFFLRNGRIHGASVIKFILLSILGFFVLYYVYAYLAANNFLGERNYNKYIAQSNTVFGNTPWGLLMSGRHYTFAAILRIIDNPIFGAGSWPLAGDAIIRTVEMLGGRVSQGMLNPYLRDIGHSVLFGIWAQNGPLVLPFILFSFIAILRFTIHVVFNSTPLKALLLIYLISLTFGIIFNNFNSLTRVLMVMIPVYYNVYIRSGAMHAQIYRLHKS